MRKNRFSFPIDCSAILYLAQMRPDHTNVYRFAAELTEPVDPQLLQQAAERICPKFPTILAGFRHEFFSYAVVPVEKAPTVRRDPGLLHIMTRREIESCAYRIYYDHCQIIIEAFHALTDGFGAVASLRALLGEYVHLKYGVSVPEREALWDPQPDRQEELKDAYRVYSGEKSGSLPQAYSYQLPKQDVSTQVHTATMQIPTRQLRKAAKHWGVSVTALLSALMAETLMELQQHYTGARSRPIRIMVPVDLRRQFPSRTLRNFILYALPTLTPEESVLSRSQRLFRFQEQLRCQMEKSFLSAQITRNVKIQNSIFFRLLPRTWKCTLMRICYHFFGETNSSITLTNLGPIAVSEMLRKYAASIQVHIMPRHNSPYNCAVLSYGDMSRITITRFGSGKLLETAFFEKLDQILRECSAAAEPVRTL